MSSCSVQVLNMCGVGDGNLYELHYQEKEVWFGKKFHMINHSASGLPSFIPLLRANQSEGTYHLEW